MADDNFTATIYYRKNCNYNESEKTRDVALPLQTPTISLQYITPQTDNDTIYYGDTLLFKAQLKYQKEDGTESRVKAGEVNFYFIDDTNPNKSLEPINTEPVQVDQDGNAGVQYIPHNNGVVVAKYSGKPYFDDVSTDDQSCRIELTERPTSIKIIASSGTQVIDPETTITLSAEVIDDITKEPIYYGHVTFLNYHGHNINNKVDGEEKVIGNPVYIDKVAYKDENDNTKYKGIANITYSPIQSATDNDLLKNIELIRAVYNYDNKLYGVNWKYYKMHSDYTSIAISRDGSLNMEVPQIKNGDTYSPIHHGDGGLYYIYQGENLYCACQVKTASGEEITNAKVTFTLTDGNYEKKIDATVANGKFTVMFTNIPSGDYILSAQINNARIIGEEVESDNEVIVRSNSNYQITTGQYLRSIESDPIYISVKPQKINYDITLTSTETSAQLNASFNKNNIVATFNGTFTEQDAILLNNKKCTFWVSELNKTYEGTLKITKTNNTYTITASPDQNIVFTSVNDFSIYAYMEGGVFTGQYNGKQIERKYPTIYSPDIVTIKVRNNPTLSLDIKTLSNIYPGEITYYVKGENLIDETVSVDIFLDNQKINTIQMNHTIEGNKHINKATEKLTGISAGNHTLKAKLTDIGFSNLSAEQSFSIDKNSLIFSLTNLDIPTSATNIISLNLKNADNTILNSNELTTDKFKVYLRREGEDTLKELNITFDDTINNTKYKVFTITTRIYDNCKWYIAVGFKGTQSYEANYNPSDLSTLSFMEFRASSERPCIMKTFDENFNIFGQVIYNVVQTKENNIVTTKNLYFDEQILVINELLDNNDPSNSLKFVRITNTQGKYNIIKSISSNTEWQQYTKLKYTINPKHAILNIFKNTTKANAVAAFNQYFNDYNRSTIMDSDILNLYDQAQSMNFVNLFWGYHKVEDKEIPTWEDVSWDQ